MLTTDALRIGSFVLDWYRVAFLLGAVVFSILAGRQSRTLERAAWWVLLATLIAGRTGYLFAYRSALNGLSFGSLLRALLDLRTGGFAWTWALPAAVLTAAVLARRTAIDLLAPALGALLIGLLPLLVRPASTATIFPAQTPLLQLATTGEVNPVTFARVPTPTLVNVWATWCPPCRLEMPLLTDFARRGYPIAFIDSRESPTTVQTFMRQIGYGGVSFIDQGAVGAALGIVGFPTTLLVGSNGKVLERHFGPLDRAQLTALFARHQITPK
ncbi:TlpA family protein disulfide reductase [Deinococcus ruber]|uniref:Thiol:disulfide interchange protein n=1 Tax=Deinococcus ruber TaxID=1848197 RepID=A0A918CLA3_9DEIO|nr:prolipoprotein diacylglyceryl transferase family protein [Deinococcus ruber]GGR27329.1 thiol:disulfide interchange protein [Deinococcus ruber]